MKEFSSTLTANEKSRQTMPAFLYFFTYEGGATYFFTDYDHDITVIGEPTAKFADPQVFKSAQITHSPQVEESETKSQSVPVSLNASDVQLRKYFISAPTKQINIEIYRVNSVSLPGDIQFADLYMEFAGIAVAIGFQGNIITANFLPPVLQEDRQVPGFFYQKTCNHRLGNSFCTVNLAPWATTVTVAAINRVDRTIEFTDLTFANAFTITDESFTGGKVIDANGNKIGVILGEANVGAGTRLWLNWWPGIQVGDVLTVYPGCLKVPRICNDMYDNLENFGGTPCIPVTNPAFNGIIT